MGYRFTESNGNGRELVYISDNELSPAALYDVPEDWRPQFVEFVRGASVFVHDTMYTIDEYEYHRGWGHSTYHDALDVAIEAEVETLVLFHHKPERSDDELDKRVDECRKLAKSRGSRLEIIAAAEGLTLTV